MGKYSVFVFLMIVLWTLPFYEKPHAQHVIIIDPAGDAKRTGRKIGDNFERGLTLQCAEKIKELIEAQAPHIKVIITRMPGDIVYDLQNASLANRLHADLFINLNFYHCQETKPTLFLYQFSYGADFACCNQGLALNTYDQAYRVNKTVTDEITQHLKKFLMQSKYQTQFTVEGVYTLPIKPLIGIVAPSVTIEAGLKNKEAWVHYVEPLVQGIIGVIK
jgi:N-acetylmuramoyl-L-alanine amidase